MPSLDNPLHPDLHTLYSDHHRWLVRWLARRLGSADHAADVAQDTFLRIITSHTALAAIREPRAFLATTAKRLLIDQARRQKLEQAYLTELRNWMDMEENAAIAPDNLLETLELLDQISVALEGLAERPRTAFLLHYLDGQSQATIAHQLGVSPRMIHKYLVQALAHCSIRLDAEA